MVFSLPSFLPSFSSTVELDQERITEYICVDTLTCDGGEKHIFAFFTFLRFSSTGTVTLSHTAKTRT
jgi:hypothetical protein